MVQWDENTEYDRSQEAPAASQEEETSRGWQSTVRDVVDAFVASIGDSTKQLSAAADAFADETLRLMADAEAKIAASLSRNEELSQTAERSAEEARSAAATAAETALAEATARFSAEAQIYLEQMNATLEQSTSRESELRTMFESAVEEARAAVDETIQASVQTLSDRLAAESRSRLVEVGATARETEERLSQLVLTAEKSVSEAMAAASAAEAASAKAAADFEARTAGLVEEIAAKASGQPAGEYTPAAPAVDYDALSRKIEDAIARASDLALSAETAATAARAAAEEARYNAEQSQGVRNNDAWTPDAAGPVLDRLEADYGLLTQVVRDLNDRISSLSLIGNPAPASEPAVETPPPASFPSAHLEEEAPIGEPPPVEDAWEEETPAYEPVYLYGTPPAAETPTVVEEAVAEIETPVTPPAEPDYYGFGAATPAADQTEEEPAAAEPSPWSWQDWNKSEAVVEETAQPETPAAEIETESAPVVQLWTTPAPAEEAVEEPEAGLPGVTPLSAFSEPAWDWPQVSTPIEEPPAPMETTPYAWAPENETPVAEEPGEAAATETPYAWDVATPEVETPAAEETTEAVAETPYSWSMTVPSPEAEETVVVEETPVVAELTETEAVAEAEPEAVAAANGERIEGRVTLNVSPITDFDRLLSLDGALGRLPMIGNVTLADYARDEVTFRIELNEPVSVDEFARELSVTAGQPIESVEVTEGHVKLHFTGMAA